MMKFMFMLGFMLMMLMFDSMIMFFYNLCFIITFMLIFFFMYKDILWMNISLFFGCEYYSILLIMLSFWIVGLMCMSLGNEEGGVMKLMVFMVLMIVLMGFFMSLDIIMFYLFFEISMIPTFFLIIYWGLNYERISAAYYLMVYMLMVSFPMLIFLMSIYKDMMSFKFTLLMEMMTFYNFNFGGYLIMYGAFFIKMPMYMFHVWLPKAHVEAPVYGSMILAGVLLKMGGYGLIRFLMMFVKSSLKYNYLIFSLSLVGSVLVSLSCLVQVDMKSLVAYSSVVHMNMMMSAMLTLFKLGFFGGYIMMVAHGLCSSGLFFMVDLYYKRISSRLMVLNKGMLSKMPSLAFWWFILCSMNFSFPISLNFVSEIFILSVILNWDMVMLVYLMMVCFFSCAYSLYLFSYVQHGESSQYMHFMDNHQKEFIIIIIHSWPLVMLLLNLMMFM
uniref:NADH-ubiquinone oxidoreductase chain 4 n=1 Tax=Tetramorium tsushimae TaxID=291737 RepID=A0A8F9WKF9_9HYME|nr:NADH dehydrogenase subunit 4 [Tetramorium tsushimae]